MEILIRVLLFQKLISLNNNMFPGCVFRGLFYIFFSLLSPELMNWSVLKKRLRASLVAQWLRIRLPMQGTRVRAPVREGLTCCGATKPMHHNYWACALEPASHNCWSPRATTTEARAPRVCAPQQEKPPQWEARAPQWRVAPARRN